LFIISKEIFLKIGFLRDKFKDTGFIFTHPGTLAKFEQILKKNLDIFTKDNIISIIPFNIPTTALGRDFAEREIKNYLEKALKILKNHPTINFGLSIRIFDYTELINLYFPLINENKNIKIINITDTFDNFGNFRNVLRTIIKIKEVLDNNLVLMASGRILPKLYPMLVYLGVDLIDPSFLLFLSAENFYDTIEYLLPIYKIKYLPCSCVACRGNLKNLFDIKYSKEKIDLLCLHNLITAKNYVMKIKQFLLYEDFRAFLEKSTLDDTNLISMLKILDKEYFSQLKYETPITQKGKIIRSLGPSSYYRPDFREFRERAINNFEPEPWTTLIVLLPCSARKPYSVSKSHKKFQAILRKFPEFPDFQEIILTSPLGAIPRQLENIYPVNSYDISVTGEWDQEEIRITSEMLARILEKYNESIPIICLLEGEYLKIIEEIKSKLSHNIFFSRIDKKVTSKLSLQSFEKLINHHKNDFKSTERLEKGSYLSNSWHRKFIQIFNYQFGIGSGQRIIINELYPLKIKPNNQIDLIDSITKEKLGVLNLSTGQIKLTLAGSNRLVQKPYSLESNIIVFDGQLINGNTLFRQGVLDYSSNLVPNNYALILNKEKTNIIGIGKLIVGSNFLKNSTTGKIVEINEKKK
jgi:archaeosine synthase